MAGRAAFRIRVDDTPTTVRRVAAVVAAVAAVLPVVARRASAVIRVDRVAAF
jgi:hypothetical protein